MRYLFPALAALFLITTQADAATLKSISSNNIGTAATWGTVDATSYLNSESGNTTLNATNGTSSSFTPGAITISQIGVRLATVTNNSGTVKIELVQAGTPVSGTTVTLNCNDLVSAANTTAVQGGWVFTNFSNVTLAGATAYNVKITTASSCNLAFYTDGTANNWDRVLVTTTTAAAAAGDKLLVAGQCSTAATCTTSTATINTTSLTNYGNVANTLVDPSISISNGGILAFATTASTNFVFEHAGPMVIYSGGTFTIGTTGTPIPSTSTAVYTLNSTVQEDTGVNVRSGGTMRAVGVSGGRTRVCDKLNATANAAATSLTTTNSTGWLNGDSIFIGNTQATTGTIKDDAATLNANASGASLSLSAGITNAHSVRTVSYTSANNNVAYNLPMKPDVCVTTRNVTIQGSGATTNGYLYFLDGSVGYFDWVRLNRMSGTNTGKRGIEVDTGPTGSFNLTNFTHESSQSTAQAYGAVNADFGGTNSAYIVVQNGVFYNTGTASGWSLFVGGSRNPYWKFDNLVFNRAGNGGSTALEFRSMYGQVTNIAVTGSNAGFDYTIKMAPTYSDVATIGAGINTWGPFEVYGSLGINAWFGVSYPLTGTINGFKVWEGTHYVIAGGNGGNLTIDPFYYLVGASSQGNGVFLGTAANITVRNGIIGRTDADRTVLVAGSDSTTNTLYMDNMELCPVGTFGSSPQFFMCAFSSNVNTILPLSEDFSTPVQRTAAVAQVYLRNTSYLNNITTNWPNKGNEQNYYGPQAFVIQDCQSCTVKHGAWLPFGYLSYDTAISHASGYSTRMTPSVLTFTGSISGTALTTGTIPGGARIGQYLTSNGGGFIPGTWITSGSSSPFTVNFSQTVASSQFQSYTSLYAFSGPKMQSAPYGMGQRIAVASGQTASVCVWMRPSVNTDAGPPWGGSAVTYNGSAPRLINRRNPYMGVNADTVLGTSSLTAGQWSQVCANLPSAPADGQYEVVVDADQTFTSNAGGYINISEWSCANCGTVNDGRYWWNGASGQGVTPPVPGNVVGGFLLKRDFDPAGNDNDPMWLEKAS